MSEELQQEHLLADASVAFAVDVSGSTHRTALDAEKTFVRNVANILSGKAQTAATLLPWNSNLGNVTSLDTPFALDSLTSYGGTAPSALLRSRIGRDAILGSTVWFLMTDGHVSDGERISFADHIATAGVHGITCVTAIFGNTSCQPYRSNISVGVSVFTLCPNCLFLYYDVEHHDIMIMQAKGIFNTLLRGEECPVIDANSTWAAFPRLSIKDLSDIPVPAPKRLAKDEIQLPDFTIINVDHLWANRLDQASVGRIFSNPDNLRTVVMQAQCRNQAQQYQEWAPQQRLPDPDPLWKPRIDVEGRALRAFTELKKAIDAGHPDSRITDLRATLRRAHELNMNDFLRSCREAAEQFHVREALIMATVLQSAESIHRPQSLNYSISSGFKDFKAMAGSLSSDGWSDHDEDSPTPTVGRNRGSVASWTEIGSETHSLESYGQAAAPPRQTSPPGGPGRAPVTKTTADDRHSANVKGLLWTPGFRNGGKCALSSARGTCSICGATSAQLVLLFKTPPGPAPPVGMSACKVPSSRGGSVSPDWPWFAGVAKGNEVLVTEICCCDPCSTYCVSAGMPRNADRANIPVSLPIVGYNGNAVQYTRRLEQLLGDLEDPDLAPMVFLSMLTKARRNLQRDEYNRSDKSMVKTLLAALSGVIVDLLDAIKVTPEGLPCRLGTVLQPSKMVPLQLHLKNTLRATAGQYFQLPPSLLAYPIAAFVAIIDATAHIPYDPAETHTLSTSLASLRLSAVLRRYLYCLAEKKLTGLPDGDHSADEVWTVLSPDQQTGVQEKVDTDSGAGQGGKGTALAAAKEKPTGQVGNEQMYLGDFEKYLQELDLLRQLPLFSNWEKTSSWKSAVEVFARAVRISKEGCPDLPPMEVYRIAIAGDEVVSQFRLALAEMDDGAGHCYGAVRGVLIPRKSA